MVQHIVFWNFKDEFDKNEVFAELQLAFAPICESIPGIKSLSLHRGYQGYDACLITIHEDAAALNAYQEHPAHQKVKAIVATYKSERASCDFEL